MSQADELLDEFAQLVADDSLPASATRFLRDMQRLVDESLGTGDFFVPADPFKGSAPEAEPDPNFYYTQFWRMFDRTPASMIQGFAIPLRRILAQKVFGRCGDGVIIHHNVLFNRGANIELGDHVFLNRNVMLDDRGPLRIGHYTLLAAGVTVETHTHRFEDFSTPIATAGRDTAGVTIGPNSLIGYNAVVMAGVNVGERCIVAANSVATEDVADFTVVGGVPARFIKELRPPADDANVWQPEPW